MGHYRRHNFISGISFTRIIVLALFLLIVYSFYSFNNMFGVLDFILGVKGKIIFYVITGLISLLILFGGRK